MAEPIKVSDQMQRRSFLRGALAVTGIPPLCCISQPLPSSSVEFGASRIRIDLARVPELRRIGAAFSIVDEARKINLLVMHPEGQRYVAMDRTCTHGGAQCTYNHRHKTLQCTSLNHAEYDLNGRLLHGRTHGDVQTYVAGLSGAFVEIIL